MAFFPQGASWSVGWEDSTQGHWCPGSSVWRVLPDLDEVSWEKYWSFWWGPFLCLSLSVSVCLSVCLSLCPSISLSVCLCSSQEICHNPLQFNLTTKLYKFYTRVEDSTTLSCCGTSWSDISYLKEQPDYCFSISITSSYRLAFPLSVSHPSTLILLLSISN